MKVKLLTGRAGLDFAQAAGEVIDVSAEEAQRLVDSGQAMPHRDEPQVETATSVKPTQRKPGRKAI